MQDDYERLTSVMIKPSYLKWIKSNYGTLKNFIAYMVNQERSNDNK